MTSLRVVDAGTVEPYRSQALWHGLASAMGPNDPAVLSFCRPSSPYISLGFHRCLAEIDRDSCARRGWPIVRRQIGGGPVYLDSDQLFFQITMPAGRAPVPVHRLYEAWLTPAVEAFQNLGLAVGLRGTNDIAIADRRLSGTGAGRIGEAVTIVGNVIFRFPHRLMVDSLALPNGWTRRECLRLMRRHVSSLAGEGRESVSFDETREALVRAYARRFSSVSVAGSPSPREEHEIEGWKGRMRTKDWLGGEPPRPSAGRQIKICAGVWVFSAVAGELQVQFSVVDGRLDRVRVAGVGLNGEATKLGRALAGLPADSERLASRLRDFGELGARLGSLARPGLTQR